MSETQFVNDDPEESPQRLQMSPLLSSPGDQSPTTCRAVLSNFNDDRVLWCNRRRLENVNDIEHNKETVDENTSMQALQTENFQPGVPFNDTNAITLSMLPSGSGSSASDRQPSDLNSSSDMLFFPANAGVISDNNVRQNCNNEQR